MSCSGQKRKGLCLFFQVSQFLKQEDPVRHLSRNTLCVCVCLCGDGWELSIPVVPNLFVTRDLFPGRQFFHSWSEGDGFRVIQAHYIFCAIYFNLRLWPGGWGPLVYTTVVCTLLNTFHVTLEPP